MNHRRDVRSVDEFRKAIADCTAIERKLMEAYVAVLNAERGVSVYSFRDHGVDNSGDYIADDKKINTKADFLLCKKDGPTRKIEIKFSRKDNATFHLKVSQMESYVKNDVCVVNFIDVDGDNPRFCILRPADLQDWLVNGERLKFAPWGFKYVVRFDVGNSKLKWHKITL